jgi:hypothetical protein
MSARADRLRDLITHCNSKAEHAAGVEMRALWLNVRDSYRLLLRAEEGVAADMLTGCKSQDFIDSREHPAVWDFQEYI